jgi:hypothetical protein
MTGAVGIPVRELENRVNVFLTLTTGFAPRVASGQHSMVARGRKLGRDGN